MTCKEKATGQLERQNILAAVLTAIELHICFSPNLKFLGIYKTGSTKEIFVLRIPASCIFKLCIPQRESLGCVALNDHYD